MAPKVTAIYNIFSISPGFNLRQWTWSTAEYIAESVAPHCQQSAVSSHQSATPCAPYAGLMCVGGLLGVHAEHRW